MKKIIYCVALSFLVVTLTGCKDDDTYYNPTFTTVENGEVMFWTSNNPYAITVTINNTTAKVTSRYSNGVSDCGATGCATFTLKPGTYNYYASDSEVSWNETVTVYSNRCTKMNLRRW